MNLRSRLTIIGLLAMAILGICPRGAAQVSLQPTPLAYYYWDTSSSSWLACPNSSALEASANTPQAVVAEGFNSGLGQWTPVVGLSSCPGQAPPASSIPFTDITSGTNSVAVMHVDTGGRLDFINNGVINASSLVGVAVTGSPTSGQVLTATDAFDAVWSTPSASVPTCSLHDLPYYAVGGATLSCLALETNLSSASNVLYVGRGGGGSSSLQLGTSASAASPNSVALGQSASATGTQTIAIGNSAVAFGNFSMAIGPGASASSSLGSTTAVGPGASVTNNGGTAIGANCTAAFLGVCLGENASASTPQSVAIGEGIVATQADELVLGTNSVKYIDSLPNGTSLPLGLAVAGYAQVSPLATAGAPSGAQSGSGTVANGTYYAKLSVESADGTFTQVGTESTGVVVSGGGTTGILWNWTAVPGGYNYRLWVGTSPGAETSYFNATAIPSAGNTSILQTSTSGTAGTPPTVNETGTAYLTLIMGPATAPTGACTTGAWVWSQDGKGSYCKAGTWEVAITAP